VSSFTLGIDEPDVMARKARAARGWPILKVKLGVEREREEAILDAVRAGAPDAALRVDANAGWTADEALERIPRLAERGVEFVEQPLPPEDREGLRRVRERSPLPIVLDESCVTAADVPGLVGMADGVNVKLAKCGGPREGLRAIHAARACGLKVMLGCMLETSLGIAPAAHLSPLVDWADLDGAHLLAEDPFRGPGPVAPGTGDGPGGGEPGRVVLSDVPGLGVVEA
jgi:L-alanine-DL-glutamate epimerase-like enolase superfamily enzyme